MTQWHRGLYEAHDTHTQQNLLYVKDNDHQLRFLLIDLGNDKNVDVTWAGLQLACCWSIKRFNSVEYILDSR